MNCFRVLLLLLVLSPFSGLTAGEPAVSRNLTPGCWVRYRLAIPSSEGAPAESICLIRVLSIRDALLDLEVTVDGVSARRTVTAEGFNPASFAGFRALPSQEPASEQDCEYTPALRNQKQSARLFVWKSDGEAQAMQYVRVPGIPFGLGRLTWGQLILEATDFSWGERPPTVDSSPPPATPGGTSPLPAPPANVEKKAGT